MIMKSPIAGILVGAATVTAAIYLLNKYFKETAKQKQEASLQITQAECPDLEEDPCTFPEAMLVDHPNNQVDNWGQLSDRHFISNHNFNSVPDDL
jgi:hypothetical protein